MRGAVAAAGWAVLAAGCEQPRTELVARVDSDLTWGPTGRVPAVTITVRRSGPSGELRSVRTTVLGVDVGLQPLPLTVGLLPALVGADDLDAPVWIEALGCPTAARCSRADAVVAQRAVVTFVRGETLEVPLLLASACAGVACTTDQRCADDGRCEAATGAQAMLHPGPTRDAGTPSDLVGIDRQTLVDTAATDAGAVVDRNDLGGGVDSADVDIGTPMDVASIDVLGTDTVATPDTAASCGPLELRCGGACTRVLTDPANCGECGVVCPAIAGAAATCMGGRCGYACDTAHADCDERPSNGCESERASDHQNCGACGTACDESQRCEAGACVRCGGGSPLWCPGTGCTSRTADARNCGGCGNVCPLGAVCQGNCAYVPCTPTSPPPDAGLRSIWIQCPAGCIDTENDPRNCGRCGNVCPPESATCTNGGCRDGICPGGYRLLPAGSFMMGGGDAGPVHRVTFARPSCIMAREVTNVEYSNCHEVMCVRPTPSASCPASVMNWPPEAHEWQPMNCLPWSAADAYCRTQNLRLPTEAEWEYAARGTDGRAYPWGNTPPSVTDAPQRLCWNRGTEGSCDWREFSAGASAFHAFHMAGNLAEWVSDWHGGYPSSDQTDPRGPSSGTERVVRGGSWMQSTPGAFTATARASAPPITTNAAYGFRCIWTP